MAQPSGCALRRLGRVHSEYAEACVIVPATRRDLIFQFAILPPGLATNWNSGGKTCLKILATSFGKLGRAAAAGDIFRRTTQAKASSTRLQPLANPYAWSIRPFRWNTSSSRRGAPVAVSAARTTSESAPCARPSRLPCCRGLSKRESPPVTVLCRRPRTARPAHGSCRLAAETSNTSAAGTASCPWRNEYRG